MSRVHEIIRRVNETANPGGAELALPRIEASSLWPRFAKVFAAIESSLQETPPPLGITRQLSTFSWSGVDEGIHDHNGFICGKINGIELNIKLKGTTADDQQQFVIDSDGGWRLTHTRERCIDFIGTFVSADGKKGAIEMQNKNGTWEYQAFWLQRWSGFFQLEQVVGSDGVTFDADKIDSDKKEVTIPGTDIAVARLVHPAR